MSARSRDKSLGIEVLSLDRTRKYHKGETVFIRAKRSQGGTVVVVSDNPDWSNLPVLACRIDQVGFCGLSDVYGLTWEDNREPVGLPFYADHFCDKDGNPVGE